jgi:anti-sigma regulatory factor (Ser/Thr protein kinase)
LTTSAEHANEKACLVLRESWSNEDARRFAELVVGSCDPACREATTMAVGELAENLVKYGAQGAEANAGTIAIRVERDRVRIRAESAVMCHEDARCVVETIARIRATSNVIELYRARLQELFENPSLPRAQLGLLRVASEGGFRLSCTYAAPSLEIAAERPCGASQ